MACCGQVFELELVVEFVGEVLGIDQRLVGPDDRVDVLEEDTVFGSAPERDVTRWFSDASVLTRYGIATLNYGTSTGLLDTAPTFTIA